MTQKHKAIILFIWMVVEIIGEELPTLPKLVVSTQCMRHGICEMVENYPTVLARKLIQELKDRNTLFADDTVLDINQESGQPEEIGPNFRSLDDNEPFNEIQLCESTVQNKIPKIAENRNNTWKFILNDDQEPIQIFRSERCKSKHSECSKKVDFISNYKGVCVQGWILKEMYYIDENGNSATDYFKVPTCCSCRLFHNNK